MHTSWRAVVTAAWLAAAVSPPPPRPGPATAYLHNTQFLQNETLPGALYYHSLGRAAFARDGTPPADVRFANFSGQVTAYTSNGIRSAAADAAQTPGSPNFLIDLECGGFDGLISWGPSQGPYPNGTLVRAPQVMPTDHTSL